MTEKIDPRYAVVTSNWEDGYVKLYSEDDRDLFNPITLGEETRDCQYRFMFHKQNFAIECRGNEWTIPRVGAPWDGWFLFTDDHKIVTKVVVYGKIQAGDVFSYNQDSRRVDLYANQSSTRRIRRR
jgi:hypothetical protein